MVQGCGKKGTKGRAIVALWLASVVLWPAWIYEVDDTALTLGWDSVSNATRYEVKVISKHPEQEWLYPTTATQVVVQRPRSGLFRFAVRACDDSNCSDWAYSDGPTASVTAPDGTVKQQPWGVFWRLTPVILK